MNLDFKHLLCSQAVADPGFPAVRCKPRRGGCDHSRHAFISKNLYIKMKELEPLGRAMVVPTGSANNEDIKVYDFKI